MPPCSCVICSRAIATSPGRAAYSQRWAPTPRAAIRWCSTLSPTDLKPLIDLLAKSAPGRSKAERRRKGVAAMAGLVGALLLARAVGKGELSDEILEATRRELLAAGGR